jgi:hypothetical protein
VSGLAAIARPACMPKSTATDSMITFFDINPPPCMMI